jgi:hypothetical protein
VAVGKKILSLVGRLVILAIFAFAFLMGMMGAIWFSLRGEEVIVPEIVGKDFYESEKELASLGLKIKRRAYRYSNEKPNTIIEQAPRPGETVKTGQTILVVVAQASPESTEAPAVVKKETAEEDSSSEVATEDSRKNRNSNLKKLEKTRDVISSKANKNSSTDLTTVNSSVSKSPNGNKTEKKPSETKVESRPTTSPSIQKSPTPPTGDVRNRRVIP